MNTCAELDPNRVFTPRNDKRDIAPLVDTHIDLCSALTAFKQIVHDSSRKSVSRQFRKPLRNFLTQEVGFADNILLILFQFSHCPVDVTHRQPKSNNLFTH
jgi:hypothetical protein